MQVMKIELGKRLQKAHDEEACGEGADTSQDSESPLRADTWRKNGNYSSTEKERKFQKRRCLMQVWV